MTDMPRCVLPAVDAAVARGVADPEHVAVSGASFGGYAVLALITQTKRFRAATAYTPVSDRASLYGTFIMPLRYSKAAHDRCFRHQLLARWV